MFSLSLDFVHPLLVVCVFSLSEAIHIKGTIYSSFDGQIMESPLRRWLHKLQWLTNPQKNTRELHKPQRTPPRYVCDELTSEFVKYWRNIQEENGEELVQIQVDALKRWCALQRGLQEKEEAAFPLEFCFQIFDDYLFLGSLGHYTKVKWVPDTPANSHWDGFTNIDRQNIFSRQLKIRIMVKRQNVWDNINTLLHEMVHAFLMIYSVYTVDTEGITGHGPCWVEVAVAIAAEANRSFGGWCDPWDLGIRESYHSEVEAQEQLVRR